MKTINKLENGRAAFAYRCAEEGSELEKRKEYKAYVKKIPMLIKTNGLGATVAFMKSKGGTYTIIYDQLTNWFKRDENPFKFEVKVLAEDLCEMSSQQYRAITKETLALFNWLRIFAEGLIEDKEGE